MNDDKDKPYNKVDIISGIFNKALPELIDEVLNENPGEFTEEEKAELKKRFRMDEDDRSKPSA